MIVTSSVLVSVTVLGSFTVCFSVLLCVTECYLTLLCLFYFITQLLRLTFLYTCAAKPQLFSSSPHLYIYNQQSARTLSIYLSFLTIQNSAFLADMVYLSSVFLRILPS
jgi:hypothetical protein